VERVAARGLIGQAVEDDCPYGCIILLSRYLHGISACALPSHEPSPVVGPTR
jgi:hypothetical protein